MHSDDAFASWRAEHFFHPDELDVALVEIATAERYRCALDLDEGARRRECKRRARMLELEARQSAGLAFASPGIIDEFDILPDLKIAGLFGTMVAYAAARLAAGARLLKQHSSLHELVSPDRLHAWFAARWGIPASGVAGLLERRGFPNHDEFVRIASLLRAAELVIKPIVLNLDSHHAFEQLNRK